jgi:spore coat polysaccharide biosynthesis protein SpsF
MRAVAIVQARMGSTRLPGKVLCDLAGMTMLARVVDRLRDSQTLDTITIATTTAPADDAIVEHAAQLGAPTYRGSADDVLARYLGAARAARADVIVRVTSDCPLIDAGVVDLVVGALEPDVDYASNTHVRTYPRGLDVEAFHRDTLERLARMATTPSTREHVTSFVMQHPAYFKIAHVVASRDDSDLRWTVDTEEDLELALALYERGAAVLGYRELVDLVRSQPELAKLNAHVTQKSWQAHA